MATGEIELTEREAQPTAVVRGTVAPPGLPEFLAGAFGEVMAVLAAQHLAPAGPPFGRYRVTPAGFDVEAGFPATAAVEASGRVVPAELPGGPVVTATHRGGYETVGTTYEAVTAWLAGHGYQSAGEPWECYLDGPEVAEPRTLVCFPVRAA
ncbi:MAG TPA: GyrI-like domain-containing protein [Blastococcus sp.]|jgi:effector-binding domain-containing protein|nr:GyrI-like domain-containing protein [Blastococcus sp.]